MITVKTFFIRTLMVVSFLALLLASLIAWVFSFVPDGGFDDVTQSTVQDVPYLSSATAPQRGRILTVVTSIDKMGDTGKKTGYELTELARAYWVFTVNGYEVDIASTLGGEPPMIIDDEDMGVYDYAFLNDQTVKNKLANTLLVDQVNADDYDAVYFVGGKGTMFDFVDNPAIKRIVTKMHSNGAVISAVCHGPAALLNVTTASGEPLLKGRQITSFTNSEELFLKPDAEQTFGFLLETGLAEQGASFVAAPDYLEQVVVDGNIVTGQNPWSVWAMSEQVIKSLGVTPKHRAVTGEERSIAMMGIYRAQGYDAAIEHIESNNYQYKSLLVVMHAILEAMKFDLIEAGQLMALAQASKS